MRRLTLGNEKEEKGWETIHKITTMEFRTTMNFFLQTYIRFQLTDATNTSKFIFSSANLRISIPYDYQVTKRYFVSFIYRSETQTDNCNETATFGILLHQRIVARFIQTQTQQAIKRITVSRHSTDQMTKQAKGKEEQIYMSLTGISFPLTLKEILRFERLAKSPSLSPS